MSSGKLAVFSPVALTQEAKSRVSELGEVSYISCLDYEHHLFIGEWSKAFPKATTIGVEGLQEKRAKQKNEDVVFDKVFTKENKDTLKIDDEFDSEFDYEYVPGHGNKELVFNFRKDRTLIQGDLLFNLPATEQYSRSDESPTQGLLTRFFNAVNSTSGDALWQRRFIWYAISAGDRPSYNNSVSKIDKWAFDRIIPCHGDVVETGGKGLFQKVMQWHLEAAKTQG